MEIVQLVERNDQERFLRNIFDQYSQPENRVTHAFLTALNEDRRLLDSFLRDVVKVTPPVPARCLIVMEQKYPGEDELSEVDGDRRGIPDGWIVDENGWCVIIESKVISRLDADQIRRHRRTAERRGFQSITMVAITPRNEILFPPDTITLEWRAIYGWLRRLTPVSDWARRTSHYFEVAEAKLVDSKQFVEGSLTMFTGVPFGDDHPFTYLEGKRILGLAIGELRQRLDLQTELGMNPKTAGRPAITGKNENRVWDFLSLGAANEDDTFTSNPHLTLGILNDMVDVMVTVPNAVGRDMRKRLVDLGEGGFRALTVNIVDNLRPLLRRYPGATPRFRGVQRRYPSQRSKPFIDAVIEFDLRTAVDCDDAPKKQSRWLTAAYGSYVSKEGTNYQIQMGVHFPYEYCPELREPSAIEMIATAWLGCKPLVALAKQ